MLTATMASAASSISSIASPCPPIPALLTRISIGPVCSAASAMANLERRHVGNVRRHRQCFAVDHTRRLVRRILEAIQYDNRRPRCQHDGMMPPHAATCACDQRDPAVH